MTLLLGTNTGPYGPYGPRASGVPLPSSLADDTILSLAHQQWLYRLNLHGDVLWFGPVVQQPRSVFPPSAGDGHGPTLEGPPVSSRPLCHRPPKANNAGPSGSPTVLLGSPVVDNAGVIYFLRFPISSKPILPDSQSKWYIQADCNSGPGPRRRPVQSILGMNSRDPGRASYRHIFFAAFTPDGQLKWKIANQRRRSATLPPSPPRRPPSFFHHRQRATPTPIFPLLALPPWTPPGPVYNTTPKTPRLLPLCPE